MRFDDSKGTIKASTVLNFYSKDKLTRIFKDVLIDFPSMAMNQERD